MITRLHESNEWTRNVISYNENKSRKGVAEIIHYNNTYHLSKSDFFEMIDELENNPEIHGSVKNRSFQMSINPLPTDFRGNAELGVAPDEGLIRGYIDELMAGLGMGKQPYIVYRHHDIDRIHYHVVSTRCQPDGKLVSDSYWVYTLQNIEKALAVKYHFTVGRTAESEKEAQEIAEKAEKFTHGTKAARKVTKTLFTKAVAKRYRSPWEFQCQLAALGLKMKSIKGEPEKTYLIGLNDDGSPAKGRRITDREVFLGGKRMVAEGIKARGKNPCSGSVVAERMRMLSDWAMARTHSFREYRALMASFGVVPTVKRHPEKTGTIRAVAIVARKGGSLINSMYGEVPLEPFIKKESTGEWMVERRRGKPVDIEALASEDERNAILKRLAAIGKETKTANRTSGFPHRHRYQRQFTTRPAPPKKRI